MKKNSTLLTKEEIIKIIKSEKNFLSEKYFVSEIGLFGSYVRNEQKVKSDIDILISFAKSPDFFVFLELEDYLSDLFGIKVDLVTKNSLKPIIGSYIKKEVEYI
ncbi:MAG: nucleotidyltransferase [Ignavibacteria bacterium]|nr:nucleotidyltransferase [Ignavibacteria bacterium]